MRIGIDVDGTMTDISSYMLEKGEKFAKRLPIDPAAFDIERMFGFTKKERNAFWGRYLLGYCIGVPIADGASEAIRKLHEEGHWIYIVTSRVFTTGKSPAGALSRQLLTRWLKKNAVVYDGIVFCEDSGESKLEACQRLDIDLMIDDKPENLEKISEDHHVIVSPMPWNQGMEADGYTVARGWEDLYDIIHTRVEKHRASKHHQ